MNKGLDDSKGEPEAKEQNLTPERMEKENHPEKPLDLKDKLKTEEPIIHRPEDNPEGDLSEKRRPNAMHQWSEGDGGRAQMDNPKFTHFT